QFRRLCPFDLQIGLACSPVHVFRRAVESDLPNHQPALPAQLDGGRNTAFHFHESSVAMVQGARTSVEETYLARDGMFARRNLLETETPALICRCAVAEAEQQQRIGFGFLTTGDRDMLVRGGLSTEEQSAFDRSPGRQDDRCIRCGFNRQQGASTIMDYRHAARASFQFQGESPVTVGLCSRRLEARIWTEQLAGPLHHGAKTSASESYRGAFRGQLASGQHNPREERSSLELELEQIGRAS